MCMCCLLVIFSGLNDAVCGLVIYEVHCPALLIIPWIWLLDDGPLLIDSLLAEGTDNDN